MVEKCHIVLRVDPASPMPADVSPRVRFCKTHQTYDVGADGCQIGAEIGRITALVDIANWPASPPGGWTESDVEQIRQRARDALAGN